VLLAGEVMARLNLGPGVMSLLERLDAYLASLSAFRPAVAMPPPGGYGGWPPLRDCRPAGVQHRFRCWVPPTQ